jgi:eukaryotic-like serine/threonine-protein kinase
MGEAAAAETDLPIGRVLDGRYRVTGLIGAGGMGSVYRVEHVAIGKAMAVKILHPRLGGKEDAAARFQREALVGGKIGHPNCVAVSDFGHVEDGSFYLVMELLRGESLGERLERVRRLPWRRALHITRHVLRGLGHAHDHGVVHRDIKPDNIFLAEHDDDREFAKILDFGIAKLVGESGTTITQAGITVGTPAYLSPEQAFGGEMDGRSDLYSLSIVLYEMLVGRTPFADRDLMAMLTAHAVADVPSFADAAPDADIPTAVEALVRDGLAKQREQRIGSAAEYVARIDALLTGQIATDAGAPSGPVPQPVTSGTFSVPTATLTSSVAIALPARPWKKIALVAAGVVLAIGAVAAIASRQSDDGGRPAPEAAPTSPAAAKQAPVKLPPLPAPARPEPRPAITVPAPAPDPTPTAPTDTSEPDPAHEASYQAAIKALTKGKTCPARKAAIPKLIELGDKRAIPHLKKARSRRRGGLLGLGDKNTNSCLKADAEAALTQLGG